MELTIASEAVMTPNCVLVMSSSSRKVFFSRPREAESPGLTNREEDDAQEGRSFVGPRDFEGDGIGVNACLRSVSNGVCYS